MLKQSPHILITTPETLAIVLSTVKFRKMLQKTRYVIIDEIHDLCNSKRGVSLSLSLERLQHQVTDHSLTRIGLSATQSPLATIAQFLTGFENGEPRPCSIVDTSSERQMDVQVISPVPDLIDAAYDDVQNRLLEILEDLIRHHQTTLVFTNTRRMTETRTYQVNE